eukprot:CAMPEP_0173385158 /NCGR_PEP_ID=MMETSP1356-20130122/7763_1 /TAXON_ID=77927 ORGANISM="Hemiselmis virescens, Strain PCC157" /NCGR_SAMPLE_ID=MMETSP1356 /ASSEMBLY_ACC=CAM_ASM_000847 /LENGTH=60 /DNA_ID=CAMNT_0014340843 /DNA_START=52 /DNA_END=232 /DNA_ORIENTATION=+
MSRIIPAAALHTAPSALPLLKHMNVSCRVPCDTPQRSRCPTLAASQTAPAHPSAHRAQRA